MAKRLLEQIGCRVDTVNDGNDAVARLKDTSYDLIFMDCHMPEMDGFEATRIIRQTQSGAKRVPVVALTASVTPRDRKECLIAGMDDFLGKPLDAQQLRAAIEKWRRLKFDSAQASIRQAIWTPAPYLIGP